MKPSSRRSARLPSAPWRVLAAGLAWMVLGLTLIAASPEAHELVHRGEQVAGCEHAHPAPADSADHVCAVVLFAGGVEPAAAVFLALPELSLAPIAPTRYAPPFLRDPRYLRQPERGPPAA